MKLLMELVFAFWGTNMDNFLFIALMLAVAATKSEKRRVITSQYAGLALLVAISMAASSLLRFLPLKDVRCLGAIPILIGARGLWKYFREKKELANGLSGTIPSWGTLVMLNLSGGMDNISIYIPLFSDLPKMWGPILLALVFSGMLLLWCWAANLLAALPPIQKRVRKNSAWIVPAVYILLGLYILLR